MKKFFSKHLLFLMLLMTTMISFTSCKDDGDDDAKSGESRLVGTWVATDYADGEYVTLTLVLNKGGKGSFIVEDDYYGQESTPITWSVRGDDLLSINFIEDGDTLTYPFSLSSDGKTLYWESYTFRKK